jgi:tetratricopeptide (TPR) repeat protein
VRTRPFGHAFGRCFRALLGLVALGGSLASGRAAPAPEVAAAIALYDDGSYSAAQLRFDEIARTRPDDPEIALYRGRLALWFDDAAAGLGFLQKAVQAAPDDARMQNAFGDACGFTARHSGFFSKYGWARKCLAAYARAVALEPGNTDYRLSLLRYYVEAPAIAGGSIAKAYAEAAEIRKLDAADGRIAFATVYLTEEKFDQAFHEFDELLRQKPDDFFALYQIGRCAALSGMQLDRGLVALQRCLQLPLPADTDRRTTPANIHYRLGNILEKKGDLAAAQAEYAAARQVYPDFRPDKDTLRD